MSGWGGRGPRARAASTSSAKAAARSGGMARSQSAVICLTRTLPAPRCSRSYLDLFVIRSSYAIRGISADWDRYFALIDDACPAARCNGPFCRLRHNLSPPLTAKRRIECRRDRSRTQGHMPDGGRRSPHDRGAASPILGGSRPAPPQLPALLLRGASLDHRQLDPVHGPGLAGGDAGREYERGVLSGPTGRGPDRT